MIQLENNDQESDKSNLKYRFEPQLDSQPLVQRMMLVREYERMSLRNK